MSDFTKGPWQIESVESGYVLRASDEHETWVARVAQGYPSSEQKANAHLIASAPDMYEALKAVAEFKDIEDGGTRMWREVEELCLEALAKAKGESK